MKKTSPSTFAIIAVLMTSFATIPHSPILAQTTPPGAGLELLGHWPRGYSLAVTTIGDNVFYGDGSALVVADIAADGKLTNHRRHVIDGSVRDLLANGNLLYIAAGKGGMRVYDVSNPDAPAEIGAWATGRYIHQVSIVGEHAYLNARRPEGDPFFVDGIQIINISDPSNPATAGFWATDPGAVKNFTIVGTTMYVADFSIEGIKVADVSDPANPQTITTVETPGAPVSVVAVSGSTLYLGTEAFGGNQASLIPLDISTPSSPRVPAEGDALNLGSRRYENAAVYGSRLVLGGTLGSQSNGVLQLIDLSAPTSPALVSDFEMTPTYGIDLYPAGIAMDSTRLYSASRFGLLVFETADPQALELLEYHEVGGTHENIWVENNTVYTASWASGMHILDASDPQNIREQAQLSPRDLSFDTIWLDVAVRDGIAIGATIFSTPCFDVSDPGDIKLVRNHSGGSRHLAFSDSYLYAFSSSRHTIFDASADYSAVSAFSTSMGLPQDVVIDGARLLASFFFEGVTTHSLANPLAPAQVGGFQPASFSGSVGLAVSGDFLLHTDLINGVLRIVNISNLAAPFQVGSIDLGTGLSTVAVDGPFAYVGGRGSGLFLVDISDPTRPELVSTYDGMAEGPRDIVVTSERVYVSASHSADESLTSAGIYVFRNALTTSVAQDAPDSPIAAEFGLGRNYPNPFNPATTIPFSLKKAAWATLSVFDAAGREIARLLDGWQPAGQHQVTWNAGKVNSGVYFFRLTAGDRVDQRRAVLVK